MASPSDAASPATLSDSTPDDRNDRPDTESTTSRLSRDEADSGSATCRWKTPQFYDQECSRYFDCPSHAIERRLSIDQTEQQESPRLVFQSEELPYDIYSDRDHSRQDSLVDTPHTDTTSSAGSSPREGTSGDWLASLDSPGLAQTSSQPREIQSSEVMEQGGDTQTDWNFAQDQPRIRSSFGPYSGTQRDAEDLDPAPGRFSEPPQRTSTGQARPYPDVVPGPYSPPAPGGQASPQGAPRQPHSRHQEGGSRRSSDFVLPRWQPDAEVTYCPICQTQFSFFVRKHHCRKCGRVVCNSCSPHRIIIPHQYIVRPPGSDMPLPQSLLMDSLGVGYIDVNGMSGGERVRLCNPCVPDPNTAPPQGSTASPTTPSSLSPRSSHQRSRSSIGDAYGAATSTNRYGVVFASGQSHDPFRAYAPRNRSISMNPAGHAIPGPSSSRNRAGANAYSSAMGRYPMGGTSSTSVPSYPGRYSSLRNAPSSSRHRNLPPTPQIAEEDECPICHRELPQRHLPNFESLRESHINSCIQTHSTYGSPRPTGEGSEQQSTPPPRRTGMYTYTATEKDCIDDAECTICLEEFAVGVGMARLECLCRFHRNCISAWFVNHPGRCPVHQHDGFGY